MEILSWWKFNLFKYEKKILFFLIENKIDLVDKETIKNITELSEFSQNNYFSGFYRTNAKTGENMETILNSVIDWLNRWSLDLQSNALSLR